MLMTVKIGDDFQKLTKYYRGKIGGYLDWSTKPKIYKQYPNSKKIELTIPDQIKLLPLDEAIKNRKSIRNYSKKPISLDQVAYLLWSSTGIQRIQKGYEFSRYRNYLPTPNPGVLIWYPSVQELPDEYVMDTEKRNFKSICKTKNIRLG